MTHFQYQNAAVAVVDIRGFTEYSGKNMEAFIKGKMMLEELWRIVVRRFPQSYVKPALDGMMTIRLEPPHPSPERIREDLMMTLNSAKAVTMDFYNKFKDEGILVGWGLAAGIVSYLAHRDYFGITTIAFRLCDYARPEGYVLDESFSPIADILNCPQREIYLKGFGQPIMAYCSPEVE